MLDKVHIRLLYYRFVTLKLPWWRIRNIQSNFWRFYMNDRDGAFLTQKGNVYPLQRGRLYFIPADVRFDTNLEQDVHVGHFYVHFDVIGLSPLVMRELFAAPICLPQQEALEARVWGLVRELTRQEGVELVQQFMVKAILYEGLTLYLHTLPVEQLQRASQAVTTLEPVLPAIEYIEAHIAEPLRSDELAQLCHMNPDYFNRRFRECVGQTPGKYIREQRVKRAERQLLMTDQSIEQIASENGFGSRFYFSRVFAQQRGTSPVAYRKGLRGD